MITKKEIYAAQRRRNPGRHLLWNHSRNSASILSKVSSRLDKASITHILDNKWPFHLVAYISGKAISIFSGGSSNLICILPLKKDGRPSSGKYEVSFLTPDGAVNFIVRKYG